MKKVWSIGCRLFWACNGQEVADVRYLTFTTSTVLLTRKGDRRLIVQLVPIPKNRCKNCGAKQ